DYSESSEGYVDADGECEGEDEEEEEEDEEEFMHRRMNTSQEDLLDVEPVSDDVPTEAEMAASRKRCEDYTTQCEWALRKDISEEMMEELRESLSQAIKIIGASIIIVLTLIGAVILYNYIEKHRMRGMIFETRIERLPMELPPRRLQLRTYMYRVKQGQFDDFTPFIASSESQGKLHVVTNVPVFYFTAYYVEHPGIKDVVMITDDFFCSPLKCFYLTDSSKGTLYKNSSVIYRSLTYQLMEVPLPTGFHFINAEYCAFFHNPACQLIVEANGTRSLAFVQQRSRYDVPSIHLMKESFQGDVKTTQYSFAPERIITWDDGRLAVFSTDANFTTHIDDVDHDEIVEVLPLNERKEKEHVHILIVMKQLEDKTRVRVIALAPDSKIVRRDELFIPAPPSAITALMHKSTFEICHLTRSQIECSVNVEPE
ncbi:hypothetical protein PMAYCL1PPCAC_26876, partial [Pristionchus mayeri]